MWKTVLALLVTIILIPILAFTLDEPPTGLQKEVLHTLLLVYLVAAGLCFLVSTLSRRFEKFFLTKNEKRHIVDCVNSVNWADAILLEDSFSTDGTVEASPEWAQGGDPDMSSNVWWDDRGVHPNPIVQLAVDPIGGSQGWYDTVVTVTKAEAGDRYGDVDASVEQSIKDYEENLRLAYTGDLHRVNHAEVDIDWNSLPRPEMHVGGH